MLAQLGEILIGVSVLGALAVTIYAIVRWEKNDNARIEKRMSDRAARQGAAFDRVFRGEISEEEFNRQYDAAKR